MPTMGFARKAPTVSPQPTFPSEVVTFTMIMIEAQVAEALSFPSRIGSMLVILDIFYSFFDERKFRT
jgi:hypothetical protein